MTLFEGASRFVACFVRLVSAFAATLSFFVSLTGVARAVDGVVEINQTSALAGGITPGDAAGFPVTLSQRGAYRLTGNLTLPDANTIGIDVTIDGVSIDLNGFAIVGPVVCIGVPVSSCTAAVGSTGIGVRGPDHVAVRNGSIRGTGSQGISLAWNARVEKVDVSFVAPPAFTAAIAVGNQSLVSESAVTSGGRIGIAAGNYAIVRNSTSTGNAEYGILGATGTLIQGCTVSENVVGLGFFGLGPGAYAGNTITSNTGNTINGTAVNLGGNLCNNALCP